MTGEGLVDKNSRVRDILSSLWKSSVPLSEFEQPILVGLDKELDRAELQVSNPGIVQSREIRSFARNFLTQAECRQIRFSLKLSFDTGDGSCELRAGLEEELTKILGKHWHGGHFGVLENEIIPVVWIYGLELVKRTILDEVYSCFIQRKITRALLVVDLDLWALEKGF